ncbi:MAG: hypothetical protein HY785_09900 [Oscillatoriophycideae cyanobacterium NC_groundwater_1537_Pr4_S-0.65um_50_18]|nr:hypothetical protein [Oscillatoriophycideae cyanobacterium NC_groundwater_1537_Pr4_S-0.65um_50_18]
MKFLDADLVRAITPIVLAGSGTLIGIFAIVQNLDPTRTTAAMGLAGTALAGAAGLAQGKTESDFSVRQKGDSLQIETPNKE